MDDIRLVKISKFLSKHLRHDPEGLGLTLAPGGWVPVDALLAACARRQMLITRAELEEVVTRNSKQRFSFSANGVQIRANQGHSVAIDLQLAPATPPDVLYHGTGHQTAPIIVQEGLHPIGRNHVHLSRDADTARAVGARHGRPVIFQVDAAAMFDFGCVFYRESLTAPGFSHGDVRLNVFPKTFSCFLFGLANPCWLWYNMFSTLIISVGRCR